MDAMNDMEPATKTVSVLIVDDQKPFRDVANTVVRMTAGFEVTGEAESAEDAIDAVDARPPDLVLMDINLPGINGIEACARITAAHPDVHVILLSTYSEQDLPQDARACGALRYVHKEEFSPALLQSIWGDVADR
ncbi:MAG TPA: response regulator transcription factor [Acidimicrobiia bacterium]|jgi:DNA-binding NarL/FixJ family response regulator|nr:response regulator transcription factor [Acidimicrobiia bacterium]